MFSSFYSGSMIAIVPKRSFAILPLVVFLSGAASHQLQRARDHITLTSINHKKVNVIRGDRVIQNHQTITVLGF
jgi:hypothetical protein